MFYVHYIRHSQYREDDFFFFFSDPDLIFNTGTGNTPSPADNDRFPPVTTHRRNARAEHTRAQKARRVADLCCDCPECNLLLATMRLERFLLLGLRPHWRVSRCFCPRWRRGHRPRYRALCAQAAASASSISTVSRGGSRRARCARCHPDSSPGAQMAHVSAQAERSGRARSATRLRWQKVSTGAGVKDECVVRTSANVPRPGSHRVKKMERCGTRCIAAAFLDFFMSVSVSDTMPRAT